MRSTGELERQRKMQRKRNTETKRGNSERMEWNFVFCFEVGYMRQSLVWLYTYTLAQISSFNMAKTHTVRSVEKEIYSS